MSYRSRRVIIFAAAVVALMALGGCAGQPAAKTEAAPTAKELTAQTPALGQATPATADSAQASPSEETAQIIRGTGELIGHPVPHSAQTSLTDDGGITLNFVNADVRDVAKAILGDFLNLNYSIGAGVQGTITLQTSKPLSRREMMSVFEQVLRMDGLAIVKSNGVYKIELSSDAPRDVSAPIVASTRTDTAETGYGTQIVPLHFIGAAEMQHLLESMQPAQAIVHADAGRNLLIIQGTQQERQAVVDEIALFDVDWLAGMSFGMFTPKYTDALGLTKELTQILGGANSPLGGIVKFVPIERLNTVLVISPQPRYLDQVQSWVARLDKPGVGSDRRIFVYAVQNGQARSLAATLRKVLYGGGGTKSAADDTDNGDNSDSNDDTTARSQLPATGEPASAAPLAPSTHGGNGGLITESSQANTPPGTVTITADETNNAIVVYGTPQEYATIEAALHELDKAPLQVLLEVAIAEVTLTNDLQYGVQYFYQPSAKHQLVLSNSNSSAISSAFPGFSYMFSEGTTIQAVLNTLSQITHVEVVSSPEILVLNNHEATLQVGDQVPIATSQAQSVVAGSAPVINSIDYRSTGVILKVTPRVNQGGMVTMEISQEVSDVSSTNTSTLDSPTITQRKINSTVSVADTETIALGGLIQDSRTRGSSGLPFLSEVPVLGGLFGTKTDNVTRTELIVLITPHVVDNLQKARAVTEELRQKLPAVQTLLRRK
jgi:general secretion pathway protein D